MNPRYPTSKQFRRHRSRNLGRPLIALGVMAGVVLYWIFSSSPTPPRKAEVPSAAESRALEEEIAAHLKTTQPAPGAPAAVVEPATRPEKGSGSASDGRKLAVIDPPSLTDPTGRLEAPETPVPAESVATTTVPPAKHFTPVAAQARKPAESAKGSESAKGGDSGKAAAAASKAGDAGRKSAPESAPARAVTAEAEAKPAKEPEDPPMPSAPRELAPKAKPPDLDMTFYRELPKRKVIVPLEEPVEGSGKSGATQADAAQRPAATAEKSGARTGNFVVQLAVFNDSQRAAAMAGDLQKRGVPARVVRSKDGNLYRIRLGPFPTHAEATRSVTQWKLGGGTTLIFQDNEG
ncbi:MAG: SPOR domain-containing protein [Magnetococcales bacterium]|nr:SPOR domain-containing protein [Magnetococcales bacterium]